MREITRQCLVDRFENIISDYEQRQLSEIDVELNYEDLKCISECLQFAQLKLDRKHGENPEIKEIERAIKLVESHIKSNRQSLANGFEYTPEDDILQQNEAYCLILECLQSELDRQENKALTLNELKEMIGEPVYVQSLTDKKGYWICNISSVCTHSGKSYGLVYINGNRKYLKFSLNTFHKHKPNGGE